jgi:hypothetical protein
MNLRRSLLISIVITLFFSSFCSAYTILGLKWGFYSSELLPDDFSGDLPSRFVEPYLGGFLAGGEFFYVGASYNSVKVKNETSGGEIYGRIIRPCIGIRYYIGQRTKNDVIPYVAGEIFKSYTRLEFPDGLNYNSEDIEYLEKLYSPWGFSFGLGTDYGVNDFFSLGMETGLRFYYSKPESSGGLVYGTVKEKRREIRLYTLIHLNFSW